MRNAGWVPREINILTGSFLEPARLIFISRRLELTFSAPVNLVCANLDLRAACDSSRRQTHSTELLAQILDGASDVGYKRIRAKISSLWDLDLDLNLDVDVDYSARRKLSQVRCRR